MRLRIKELTYFRHLVGAHCDSFCYYLLIQLLQKECRFQNLLREIFSPHVVARSKLSDFHS